jgi:cytochrome c-type biogenesis protein CcmH
MVIRRVLPILAACLFLVWLLPLEGGQKARMEEVAKKLSCNCGTCPHLTVADCTCSLADHLRAEIQQKINTGMTESQVIQSFVDQYGQTILSAPPRRGFNLMAWILPFLAFAVGGSVLFVFLKNQQKSNSRPTETVQAKPEDDYYGALLDRELNERK